MLHGIPKIPWNMRNLRSKRQKTVKFWNFCPHGSCRRMLLSIIIARQLHTTSFLVKEMAKTPHTFHLTLPILRYVLKVIISFTLFLSCSLVAEFQKWHISWSLKSVFSYFKSTNYIIFNYQSNTFVTPVNPYTLPMYRTIHNGMLLWVRIFGKEFRFTMAFCAMLLKTGNSNITH